MLLMIRRINPFKHQPKMVWGQGRNSDILSTGSSGICSILAVTPDIYEFQWLQEDLQKSGTVSNEITFFNFLQGILVMYSKPEVDLTFENSGSLAKDNIKEIISVLTNMDNICTFPDVNITYWEKQSYYFLEKDPVNLTSFLKWDFSWRWKPTFLLWIHQITVLLSEVLRLMTA